MSRAGSIRRLFITEKPDAARDLVAGIKLALGAKVVNASSSMRDGYFEFDNGDHVAWQIGHLVETQWLAPEHKAAKRAEFFNFLPMVFKDRPVVPKKELKDGKPTNKNISQFEVLRRLIPRAKMLVNAGDIDREGQLIFDEIVAYCGVDPAGGDVPVLRLALASKVDKVIAEQVSNLKESNGLAKWQNKKYAALARGHCDAALGLNASFAWQAVTGWAKMSVGRVQSPVVHIVVLRELAIRTHKPVNYFVPVITLPDGTTMRWHAREGCEGQPGFDEHGRIISEEIGNAIVRQIMSGAAGRVSLAERKHHKEKQPLPFDKASLASLIAKRYGHKLDDVSKAMQGVYERHKAITYIGTDCKFLPTTMLEEGVKTLRTLAKVFPSIQGANDKIVSHAWRDTDDEHFGIIPTGVPLSPSATEVERQVYEAVVKRFAVQFYPEHEYDQLRLGAKFGADEFRASEKVTTVMGWKEVEADIQAEEGGDGKGDGDDDAKVDKGRRTQRGG